MKCVHFYLFTTTGFNISSHQNDQTLCSKKGLTASFLAISASFFSPLNHCPRHILLNLHQVSHPHTGEMLAEKLMKTLNSWNIEHTKVLMGVTDNGSNMVKAVKSCKVKKQFEAATTQVVEGDNSYDEEESDSDENDDDENEEDMNSDEEQVEEETWEAITLHRLPCLAHTLQLVLKEIDKIQSYNSLISKARCIVKSVRVSSVATEKLIKS